MNIQAYIASGILEDYVLGLLNEAERRDVEAKAAEYPEVRRELDEIEGALQLYAQANAVAVPEGLSARILQSIDEESAVSNATQPSRESVAKSTPEKPRRRRWPLRLLSILTALVLVALIAYQWFKSNEEQKAELNLLKSRLDTCTEENSLLTRQLEALQSAGNRPLLLNDINDSSRPVAKVFYNERQNLTYFDIFQLDAPIAGKQYQLWILTDEGAKSIGLVDNASIREVIIAADFISGATGFAISQEDLGGVGIPTEIVAVGNFTG